MFRFMFQRFWLYSFCCIFIYGCSVVPNELKNADRLIETAPDSALQILQHISPNIYKKPAHHAFYGLLLVRAMNKLHLPLKSDSLLDYSLNYYLIHSDNEQLATCYLFKGRNYKNSLQYDKAMVFYLKGLDIAQRTNDNLLLGRFNLDMGDIYLIQRDYSLSRQKYIHAFEAFTKVKLKPQAFYSFLNIGRTYHAAGDYTNAQRFYRKVIGSAVDSLEKASVLQEIAINFYDHHQFDSAMICFRQVIHYPYIGNNRAVRYSYFADLLLDLKQIDSATFYAKNAFNFYPDIVTQRECYRILANTGYLKGNIRQMKIYMNQYVVLYDSIRKIENQSKGSLIESIHSSKMEVIKTKNNQWYLVGFVLVGILIVLVLIIKLRKLSILEIQKTEIHYQHQKTGTRIDVLTRHSKTILQKIDAVKSTQSLERKKASLSEKEKLDRKIYDEILHMNDMDFFYKEMDTVLNNLVSKLRTRYPAVTSKEISWCCLYLLHIPTTDIYLLLDYKVGSLKKMKQRLAQKIIVPGIKGIDDFLTGILSE